jgi:glycosyltransferase involved in cell wall biosynthesis
MVTFVRQPQSTESVLKAGDVFIRPKPSNSFNPLLLEAMSVGAAVASCKGGVDDLVVEGYTAVTFDPADEINIYDCLRSLFDSREYARTIAKNAQKHLRQNHTVSAMVTATLKAYQDAREWFKA